MFVVVVYDIKNDRRRSRVAKTMEDYGTRVQYSVFECNINEKILDNMNNTLASVIDEKDDKIRVYRLCKKCLYSVQILGSGDITEDENVYIV